MATDIKPHTVDGLYRRWWGEQTLKGDPARNHNLARDAYRAAYAQARADLIAELQPVAEVVSAHGDPEAFGERDLRVIADIQALPCGTKLAIIPEK